MILSENNFSFNFTLFLCFLNNSIKYLVFLLKLHFIKNIQDCREVQFKSIHLVNLFYMFYYDASFRL